MIDWNVFTSYLGNFDKEQILEFVDAFLTSFPEQVNGLKNAITAKDYPAVGISAHSLKSNCRWFGAVAAGDLAFQLELMGKKEKEDRMEEVFPAFEAAGNELISELREYRKSQTD